MNLIAPLTDAVADFTPENGISSPEAGRKLGQGGFGIVVSGYLYRKDPIAIKRIPIPSDRGCTNAAFAIISVLREILTQRYCAHPALLKLAAWNVSTPSPDKMEVVIATPEMQYRSAQEIMSRLETTEKMIVIYGSACGFAWIHRRQIIHRDIKPGNIMIDNDKYPHNGDFGMAKLLVDDEQTCKMGSRLFWAPEIIVGNGRNWSYPADVFAFGVTCATIARGRIDQRRTDDALTGNRPRLPTQDAPGFSDLVNQMWASNPDERPTFDQIVAELEKPNNWLPRVDSEKFRAYVDQLKLLEGQIPEPSRGIHKALERMKLANEMVKHFQEFTDLRTSLRQMFARAIVIVCNGAPHAGIEARLLESLETHGCLQPEVHRDEVEAVSNKEPDMPPSGKTIRLLVTRRGKTTPLIFTCSDETTVADLHDQLSQLLRANVSIFAMGRNLDVHGEELLIPFIEQNCVLRVNVT
jgi:serine/threonine protein kinase